MFLTEIPPDVRPDEKLRVLGPGGPLHAELLAPLPRTGLAGLSGLSVVHLAQKLLNRVNGLVVGASEPVYFAQSGML